MKFIFIVQGEGRGHMTQAISLYNILTQAGHVVSHVIVGKSKRRALPSFFSDKIDCPISRLDSPNFIADKNNKSVRFWKTIFLNIWRIRTFLRSIQKIDTLVKEENPDTIVNFYDFLSGFYFLVKRPKVRHVAIAHQFLLSHSSFEFPRGRIFDKQSILLGNKLAAYRAQTILSLSFQSLENEPSKRLFVAPPLLRSAIQEQTITSEDHFLIYMVNHGYSSQVKEFHQKHPEIPLHCFWDKSDAPKELKIDDTLTFHRLDDTKFISYMASCRGFLTTAGFESVCEAMYMGKPVLMVPVQGHYEQACNALDAKKAGAGVSSNEFDLEVLLDYLPHHKSVEEEFKRWCKTSEETFLKEICN